MNASAPAGLCKAERLCGKKTTSTLLSRGKWGSAPHIRYCVLNPGGESFSRIMVSVPKRNFKRAVKRNLLKRRIREAFRLQKTILSGKSIDIMFVYSSEEIVGFDVIFSEMTDILNRFSK